MAFADFTTNEKPPADPRTLAQIEAKNMEEYKRNSTFKIPKEVYASNVEAYNKDYSVTTADITK